LAYAADGALKTSVGATLSTLTKALAALAEFVFPAASEATPGGTDIRSVPSPVRLPRATV
jgi:hypothetical protein